MFKLLRNILRYSAQSKHSVLSEMQVMRIEAEKGNPRAQTELAMEYILGNELPEEPEKAFMWLLKAAKQDYADAQYLLGNCYKEGDGTKQDFEEALRWYREGASQNHRESQWELGVLYYNGEAVIQNYSKAFELFTEAASQGLIDAQRVLGIMYQEGLGVEIDEVSAYMWFEIAAACDFDNRLEDMRSQITYKLDTSQIEHAKSRAKAWLEEFNGSYSNK